jgi:hypothetical protein
MSMKYLWTLTLVVVSVGLMAGAAVAQDAWAVVTEYDEDLEEDVPQVDLPSALAWDAVYEASVEAENTGTTLWDDETYDLRSVEGTTVSVAAVDRWGLTAVALSGDVPTGETETFGFNVTGPPIIGTFECDWVMANSGSPILTDLAEADTTLNRYPDILPGSVGEWAADYIEDCAGLVPPIVLGYPDGFYRPNLRVNRDAMAVYITRAMQIPLLTPAEPTFSDVGTDHWAFGYVEACADAEVVFGYGDGSYQPNLSVTRAQMAVYMARAVPLDTSTDPTEDVFPDVPVTFWAATEIAACVDAGIVSGYTDGFYRPTSFVDRGQMAVYCQRAFIEPTTGAIVNGGPDVTNVNPNAATYFGWSHAGQNPIYSYVLFDPAKLGTDLAIGTNSLWDIRFEFRTADAPTVTVAQTVVQFSAAQIAAASGDYFVAATDVPASLLTGDYLMVTFVEIEGPTCPIDLELYRTVEFNVTVPPPPPGPEGPFPACEVNDALWNTEAGMDDRRHSVSSGSFLNVAESDDLYLVLRKYPNCPHATSWADSTIAWDLCCYPEDDSTDPPTPDPLDVGLSLGLSIKWCDIEIPTGATEMKVTFEYRVDPGDFYCCSLNPCANDGQMWHGMGEPWDSEQAPLAWGAGLVDWSDPWALSTWGSEADLFASHDNPGAFTDNEFARLSRAEETVVWTVAIADAAAYVDGSGNVLLHLCGGAYDYVYIDQAILEFTIP